MDDFSTGYSSLSNLRAFTFDKIKIDGSLVKSVNNHEQAATIETGTELAFLQKEECSEVPGYVVGRPADIGTFRTITHGEPATAAQAEFPFARAVGA